VSAERGLKSVRIRCPYCGESVPAEIDCSVDRQSYIEDCTVCCRPIEFAVSVNEQGQPRVQVSRDDD
jgi:hypothetical protein